MKIYIVDAFTKKPFKGNPAGICLLEQALSEATMQNIARELGLSETAFVQRTNTKGTYTIRYFSPKKEIPLCGHATLGSAQVLFRDIDEDTIHFITSEKLDLLVRQRNDEIVMEFPLYDTIPASVPFSMLESLGLKEVTNTVYSPKNKIILLEISDAAVLASLHPDYDALLRSYNDINGVLVTAPSNTEEFDYHYRYFWPWAGTNEDPVTGGVQTFLAKYWSAKLKKTTMKAFQSSSRTGFMIVELQKDKVLISSQAVIIFEGELAGIDF
jgi:PhzF family phenazine biosynthesis protein